jgi:acetyl esterase/lipase
MAVKEQLMNMYVKVFLALATCVGPGAIGSALAQPQQTQSPGDVIRRFDKNGDGKLSREELPEQMRAVFDRVDTNQDGFVTPEEEVAFRARNREIQMLRKKTPAARGAQVPDSMEAIRDIPYADNNNRRQALDLYLPKQPKDNGKPLPVIVWIHGGAWLAGDRASGFGQLRPFVQSGDYAGVSVGYRLTNEASWPAQIHDCKAAIRWIRGNAKKYNLDPDHIGVWGSSAGGHLVAMLGTSGGVETLEGKLGSFTDQSSRVTCVVDFFGPAELLTMGDSPSNLDHNAPKSPESLLVGGTLQETKEVAKEASPVTYVSKDDPPFLIVHGDKDMTVPYNQSVRLNELLKKADVDTTLVTIEGAGHGGFASRRLNERVRAFFDKHLRGKSADIEGGTIRRGE